MNESYLRIIFEYHSPEGLEYLVTNRYLTLDLMLKHMWNSDGIFLPKAGVWDLEFIAKCLELLSIETVIPDLHVTHFFICNFQAIGSINELFDVLTKYKVIICLEQRLVDHVQKYQVTDQFMERLMSMVKPIPQLTYITTSRSIQKFLKQHEIPCTYKN
jgi:hypothetical protein